MEDDMNSLLPDMPLLVEIAKTRSFTKAAETLNLGVSTVSRRIRLLENRLGILLFIRDTHSVTVTEEGKRLVEHCEGVLEAADVALESLSRDLLHPSGRINVRMPGDIYYEMLQGAFGNFTNQWPDIHLNIRFVEDGTDYPAKPFDLAFQAGQSRDMPHVQQICTINTALFASPKLLEQLSPPAVPNEVRAFPCISLSRFEGRWELSSGDETTLLPIKARFTFDSALLARELALGGHGIALLRNELVAEQIKSKKLVRVLPQWNGPNHDLYVTFGMKAVPKRVKILVDFLADLFQIETGV